MKTKLFQIKKKNAFFSVNVVARKSDKNTPETNPYIKKFLKKTNWKPKKIGVFAGKIDYPKLGFVNKNVIRLIMFITNGPTNVNNVYEFTDWQSVKKFVNEFDKMQIIKFLLKTGDYSIFARKYEN